MWQKFIDWIKRVWGKKADAPLNEEGYAQKYENINGENITATISNKLAKLTMGDSTVDIVGDGQRAELIEDVIGKWWDSDAGWSLAQTYGKGGKVLVPTVSGGRVKLNALDQSRLLIPEGMGDILTGATIIADMTKYNDKVFYRLTDYTLEDNGTQVIRNRVLDEAGAEVPLTMIPVWADIDEELVIGNTDRLLFGFLRCPRDNRRDSKRYGVPITYGAERDVDELVEHMNIYRREYKLTRPMLGLDAALWRGNDNVIGGVTIDNIRRTVQDGDEPFVPMQGSAMGETPAWNYYAPAIRHEAMEARLNSLNRRVERACGLSQGILTERSSVNYANKDEVRSALYDTFTTITEMRKNIEKALEDVAYAIDVLAEAFGLTPAGGRGQYEIAYDWDMSLIESSEQTFAQLSELEQRGMVSKAELRQWVKGGTEEEAQEAIDEIGAQSASTQTASSAIRAIFGEE